MRIFILTALLMLSGNGFAKPANIEVELKALTTLTLHFYPGLGTRFTFPFLLDEDDDFVPYTNNNTNMTVFVPVKREPGRNFFVISIPPEHVASNKDIGNIFISVAGYQISIEMRSTEKHAKHITDVRFTMGEKAREDLIQHAIKQRTKALEQSYRDKRAQLISDSENLALGKVGMLALSEPKTSRIKEEAVLELKNGDETVLFVDLVLTYPQYSIYKFNIENDSSANHVVIKDAKLFSIDDNSDRKIPLDTAKHIPKRVEPRGLATGVIVVDNNKLDNNKQLMLEVLTDGGSIQAVW